MKSTEKDNNDLPALRKKIAELYQRLVLTPSDPLLLASLAECVIIGEARGEQWAKSILQDLCNFKGASEVPFNKLLSYFFVQIYLASLAASLGGKSAGPDERIDCIENFTARILLVLIAPVAEGYAKSYNKYVLIAGVEDWTMEATMKIINNVRSGLFLKPDNALAFVRIGTRWQLSTLTRKVDPSEKNRAAGRDEDGNPTDGLETLASSKLPGARDWLPFDFEERLAGYPGDPIDVEMFMLYFSEGWTLTEISKKYPPPMSVSTVSRRIEKVVKYLSS